MITISAFKRVPPFAQGQVLDLRVRSHSARSLPDERLTAYLERGTARPAFKRALAAQLAAFQQDA